MLSVTIVIALRTLVLKIKNGRGRVMRDTHNSRCSFSGRTDTLMRELTVGGTRDREPSGPVIVAEVVLSVRGRIDHQTYISVPAAAGGVYPHPPLHHQQAATNVNRYQLWVTLNSETHSKAQFIK